VDAATLGAIGAIVVGLAAATASWIGQRGSARANHSGAVMNGYATFVGQLQAERDKLQGKLSTAEAALAAAYAELARERADRAALEGEIARLRNTIADLERQLDLLGGPTS
jgi:septal ring factor EnvC (AmiA/AmiB activator)